MLTVEPQAPSGTVQLAPCRAPSQGVRGRRGRVSTAHCGAARRGSARRGDAAPLAGEHSGSLTHQLGGRRPGVSVDGTRTSSTRPNPVARASSLRIMIICAWRRACVRTRGTVTDYSTTSLLSRADRLSSSSSTPGTRLEFTGTLDRTGAVSGDNTPAQLSVRTKSISRHTDCTTTHDCVLCLFITCLPSQLTSAAVVPSADLSYRHQAKPL